MNPTTNQKSSGKVKRRHHMSDNLPESFSLASILAEQGVHHQEGLLEWLAKDNLETDPITIKPKTSSHEADQFSWVPLPSCSPPGGPFPIKSLALSAHVSPQTIHFQVLDKSLVSGPGSGPLSCNTIIQHSFGSFGHSNQSRKRNKRNTNWKRRSKTLPVYRWHDILHGKP